MRFWDASAVVSLLVPEAFSAETHRLRREDGEMAVWWATEVECVSALWRRYRAGVVAETSLKIALSGLADLLAGCETILPAEQVRERTLRLLGLHPLGCADAFQLAAALLWCRERPSGVGFISLDGRLRSAAMREGFTVLPAEVA